MSKSRKKSSWWSRCRARLRAPDDRPPQPSPITSARYLWIGAPITDLLSDPATAPIAVDAVFATHPDLLSLDVLLNRIARTDS